MGRKDRRKYVEKRWEKNHRFERIESYIPMPVNIRMSWCLVLKSVNTEVFEMQIKYLKIIDP